MIPFPRFLHRISCVHLQPHDSKTATTKRRPGRNKLVKLVKSNGDIEIYDRPIRAWELMEEYPKHLICGSDCFYIGLKTPSVSRHERLKPGHNYFLLPAIFFQSALSFASVLRCQSAFSGRTCFEVEKTSTGCLRIKIFEDVIFHQRQIEEEIIGVCTTPQLRKDYEQLVGRRHHWKPKLDTIAEQKTRRRKLERRD